MFIQFPFAIIETKPFQMLNLLLETSWEVICFLCLWGFSWSEEGCKHCSLCFGFVFLKSHNQTKLKKLENKKEIPVCLKFFSVFPGIATEWPHSPCRRVFSVHSFISSGIPEIPACNQLRGQNKWRCIQALLFGPLNMSMLERSAYGCLQQWSKHHKHHKILKGRKEKADDKRSFGNFFVCVVCVHH